MLEDHLCFRRPRDRIELVGATGTIVLRDYRLELYSHGAEQVAIEYRHETAYQACFDAAIAHFFEGLRSGAPIETSHRDNLETLRLVEAAYAAAGPARLMQGRRLTECSGRAHQDACGSRQRAPVES